MSALPAASWNWKVSLANLLDALAELVRVGIEMMNEELRK